MNSDYGIIEIFDMQTPTGMEDSRDTNVSGSTTSSRCSFGGSSSYNTPICDGPESTSSLVCSEEISEDCIGTVDRVRYGAWADIVFNIFERVKRSCELSYIWHTDIIADGGFDEVERLIAQATKYPKKNGK